MAERERVRERPPEREARRHDYDWNEARALRWETEVRLFREQPRVVKHDAVPWEQVHQAYHKIFTGDNLPDIDRKLRRAPIYTISARLQVLETGRKSGNHRHYHEAVFFPLTGRGHEVHDDRRYDWEPGDLVVVPAYCVHQHFCDAGPATLFYAVGDLAPQVGVGTIEQVELNPDFNLPEGARPIHDERGNLVGYERRDGRRILMQEYAVGRDAMARRMAGAPASEPAGDDLYEYFVRRFGQETAWRRDAAHVIRQRERRWEDTRGGHILWYTHPRLDTGIRTFSCFQQEIPPGGRSGKHCQVSEEVKYILDGRGYEVIDGERWDWEAGDVVAIPVCSTHQAFNGDPAHPARFISVSSLLYEFMGFGGFEHLEDATG